MKLGSQKSGAKLHPDQKSVDRTVLQDQQFDDDDEFAKQGRPVAGSDEFDSELDDRGTGGPSGKYGGQGLDYDPGSDRPEAKTSGFQGQPDNSHRDAVGLDGKAHGDKGPDHQYDRNAVRLDGKKAVEDDEFEAGVKSSDDGGHDQHKNGPGRKGPKHGRNGSEGPRLKQQAGNGDDESVDEYELDDERRLQKGHTASHDGDQFEPNGQKLGIDGEIGVHDKNGHHRRGHLGDAYDSDDLMHGGDESSDAAGSDGEHEVKLP